MHQETGKQEWARWQSSVGEGDYSLKAPILITEEYDCLAEPGDRFPKRAIHKKKIFYVQITDY